MHGSFVAGFFPLAQAAAQGLGAAFSRFALAAAPVAIAALWQGAAVAAALAICLRLAPRLSAAHRFSVWASGFAVVLALQTLPLFLHSAAASGPATAGGVSAQSIFTRPWLEFDARWTLAIAAIWLLLSAARAIDLALHTQRLHALWKNARPLAPGSAFVPGAGRRRVALCTTGELDRPGVIGFFAPRILIPDWLYARLTPGELEQVILHECEHLRRWDDWTNLLQKLCLVLFPLNPALAWIERRLCREREMACDEGVVRVTRAPRAYATCLASMAERRLERNLNRNLARRGAALSLGAFERRSELAGRVHSILWRKNALGPLGARALVSVVGCGLLAGAVALARSPQLVAFVRPPATEAQAAPLPTSPQRLARLVPFDARSAQGFRAVNAMALMPQAPGPQLDNNAARLGTHPSSARRAAVVRAASFEPRPKALNAGLKASQLRADKAQGIALPQQWIVLTTWEQVETPAAASGSVADFGANADSPDANSTPASARRGLAGTRQIAVTQLILRVYPASAVSAPGANAHAPGNISARGKTVFNSVLHRQALVPLGSGWLVIQL